MHYIHMYYIAYNKIGTLLSIFSLLAKVQFIRKPIITVILLSKIFYCLCGHIKRKGQNLQLSGFAVKSLRLILSDTLNNIFSTLLI